MRKSGTITTIPIPEELSDVLCDIIKEATIQMRGRKGETPSYGLLLQPQYNEEENIVIEANFAVVDKDGFNLVSEFINKTFISKGSMPFTTKGRNLELHDYNDECVKVRKGIHDYGVSKYHHLVMPPVYIDGEGIMFTEEYEYD